MRLSHLKFGVLLTAFVIAAAVGVEAQAQGQAQGQGVPPQGRGRGGPPQNLQVLPKDWTGQQVSAMMRTITAGLGVECSHCHVSQQDRASDAKPEKLQARKMLQMVLAINNDFLKDFVGSTPAPETPTSAPPAAAGAPGRQGGPALPPIPMKVTCYTCHRGTLKPLTVPPPAGGGGQ